MRWCALLAKAAEDVVVRCSAVPEEFKKTAMIEAGFRFYPCCNYWLRPLASLSLCLIITVRSPGDALKLSSSCAIELPEIENSP
jgi:hypothetical protein